MGKVFAKLSSFLRHSYLSKAFGFLSVAQGVNAVASFGVMTLFTRFLPTEDYGRVSLIWLFVMVLSIFVDTRLNSAFCIRYYKVSKEENVRNIYSILLFNLIAAAVVFVVWVSFPGTVSRILQIPVSNLEIKLVCLISLSMVIAKFLNSLLLVTKKAKLYFLIAILFNSILVAACGFFLFISKSGYLSYLYAHLVAYSLLAAVCLFYLFREYPPHTAGSLSFRNLRDLIKLSLPLVPDAFLLMILSGAGRYILNIYYGLALVAVYSVAYMFANIFNALMLSPFGQAITPILYEKYAKAEDEYCRFLSMIFKYYWVVLLTIILAFYSFFRELFPLLVGENYISAFNIIVIVMLGLMVSGAAALLSCTIILKEKTHLAFLTTLVSAMVNIVCNLSLIPEWGLYGAGVSSFISFLVQALLITYFTQRLIPIDFSSRFLSRFFALVAVIVAVYIGVAQLQIAAFYQVGIKIVAFAGYLLVLSRFKEIRQILTRI